MKRLSLLRHGRAVPMEPGRTDAERTLDRSGVAEVGEMGVRLLDRELIPEAILVSPALRTRQSAEILQRALELPAERMHYLPGLYLACASEMLAFVQRISAHVSHAMLVGHNPGLTDLARSFAADVPVEDFVTGAVCTLEFAAYAWDAIAPGAACKLEYDSPQRVFDLWL